MSFMHISLVYKKSVQTETTVFSINYCNALYHLHAKVSPNFSVYLSILEQNLRLQQPPPSSLHKGLSADRSTPPLPVILPPMQVIQYKLMGLYPTSRELGCPLQNEVNCPFIEPLSLTSFLQMCIPLRNFLSAMLNLRYVFRSCGAAKCGQTIVEKLLHTIAGFG